MARRLGIVEENETIKSTISESLGTDKEAESFMDDNWIECISSLYSILFWVKYNSNEINITFIQLFEHIQVKSYSLVSLCETVGSLTKLHHGRC